MSFSNIGKDALLVVPCKLAHESPNPYSHLANFIRLGNEKQIKVFFSGTNIFKQFNLTPNFDEISSHTLA